jgi:aminomethyltransferase
MDQKTALYERHVALGGKMVPFAGFSLPVQFQGILEEHRAVREHVGMFDCSHMGECVLEGTDALKNLNNLLSNSFDSMAVGACRYAIMLYEDGGCVDDMLVYRHAENRYSLIMNAANIAKDLDWIKTHLSGDVVLTDYSPEYSQIALQGPDAKELLTSLASGNPLPSKYYTFTEHVVVAGADCLVSRTGYTGEYGYEIFMKNAEAVQVWDALLNAGVVPCGLGARDTLRLEAGMPLYGHEISETIDPHTAGLDFAIKMDKPDFIGKAGLEKRGEPTTRRVGLKVVGRGIIRDHQEVFKNGRKIGVITSGTFLSWINVGAAMAYLDPAEAVVGNHAEVDVRGRRVPVEVVELPFYSRTRKK